jgi:predicted SAM-dependent methyltransferase
MAGMKLNVGCGNSKLAGYVNIDCRADSAAQVIGDAASFEIDGEVEEIYSHHMLEHLDPEHACRALAHWFSLLKAGGTVRVMVPDLSFHCKQFLEAIVSGRKEDRRHAMAGFYGWRKPDRGGNNEDAHRWGYDELALRTLLEGAGFVNIRRLTNQPFHLDMTGEKP